MNSDYYVYAYIRKSNGTPYYIGKGRKYRAFCKHSTTATTPKDKSKIIFLETNLTEIGAFALERRYIRWWGRKDLGTGILLNKTDGGEGSSGAKISHSEETRRKMSEAARGKPKSEIHRKNNSLSQTGKKLSEETKRKMSTSHTGKPSGTSGKTLSANTRYKMSIAQKGKSQMIVVCPHCDKSGGNKTMPRWHFDNCKNNKGKE
jgi:hypothetical protein